MGISLQAVPCHARRVLQAPQKNMIITMSCCPFVGGGPSADDGRLQSILSSCARTNFKRLKCTVSPMGRAWGLPFSTPHRSQHLARLRDNSWAQLLCVPVITVAGTSPPSSSRRVKGELGRSALRAEYKHSLKLHRKQEKQATQNEYTG